MYLECVFCIQRARIQRNFGRQPRAGRGRLEGDITVHPKRLRPVAEDLEGAKFVGYRRVLFQIDAKLQLIACVAMQNQRVICGLPDIGQTVQHDRVYSAIGEVDLFEVHQEAIGEVKEITTGFYGQPVMTAAPMQVGILRVCAQRIITAAPFQRICTRITANDFIGGTPLNKIIAAAAR